MEKKKYIGSKVVVILLSLILLLNGLGLIVAGTRTKKKSWTVFGILYIVAEWVLAIVGYVEIATILYFISIIHTALICHEYGDRLWERDNTICTDINHQTTVPQENHIEEDDLISNTDEVVQKQEIAFDNKNGDVIDIQDLYIEMGNASVSGKTRDALDIKITDQTGKLYVFKSKGNQITSFKMGVMPEKSYIQ